MWIIVPKYSASVQASQASTSESSWLFQALEQSVMWRGKQRAANSWLRAWKKGGWLLRLCGRICEPSTAQRGVDEWISSLPVTPVAPLVLPAEVLQRKTLATSGPRSEGASQRPVQLSLFSRMSKDTSSEDSTKSSSTCTSWGSMRNGEFTQLPKPELPTEGTGSSSWPTAVAGDSKSCGAAGYSTESVWPTPSTRDYRDGQASEETHNRNARPLNEFAHRHFPPGQEVIGRESLNASGLLWESEPLLRSIPTPLVYPGDQKRRLNSLFVEWLMGLPFGWISFAHLEMPSAPNRLH
jgi:hypothetical protein